MKTIPASVAKELAYGCSFDGYKHISNESEDSGRWSAYVTTVYQEAGKLWAFDWEEGLTENQEDEIHETPYGSGLVEVYEVEPYQVSVTKFRKVS